jgi:hypothetical protein
LGESLKSASASTGFKGVVTFPRQQVPLRGQLSLNISPEVIEIEGGKLLTKGEFVGHLLTGSTAWNRRSPDMSFRVFQESQEITVTAETLDEAQSKIKSEGKIGVVLGPVELEKGGGKEDLTTKGSKVGIEFKAKIARDSLRIEESPGDSDEQHLSDEPELDALAFAALGSEEDLASDDVDEEFEFGERAAISYSPPFPTIRAQRPDLYDAALRAADAVEKMKLFKDLYSRLESAASNARLALDNSGQVIVVPDEKSAKGLLGPKIIEAALKQSGKSLAKHLIGEDFGRVLGILDYLWKLKTVLELEKGRRLVSEQHRSMRDDAYNYKLNFYVRLWIAQNAPGADPAVLASRIKSAFWKYKKALSELWKYEDIEKNLKQGLPPYQRRPPSIRPAPSGL